MNFQEECAASYLGYLEDVKAKQTEELVKYITRNFKRQQESNPLRSTLMLVGKFDCIEELAGDSRFRFNILKESAKDCANLLSCGVSVKEDTKLSNSVILSACMELKQ